MGTTHVKHGPEFMPFCPTLPDRCLRVLCGRELGEGASRRVFVYRPNPKWVIKIEKADPRAHESSFYGYGGAAGSQNLLEWLTWAGLTKEARRWVAPCVSVSYDGYILLQHRTKPLPPSKYPKLAPAWLGWDLGARNWGLFHGRPVVVDYALTDLSRLGAMHPLAKRMVPPGQGVSWDDKNNNNNKKKGTTRDAHIQEGPGRR